MLAIKSTDYGNDNLWNFVVINNHHQPTCSCLHHLKSLQWFTWVFNLHRAKLTRYKNHCAHSFSELLQCTILLPLHAFGKAKCEDVETININLIHKDFYVRMQFIIFNKLNINSAKESKRSELIMGCDEAAR